MTRNEREQWRLLLRMVGRDYGRVSPTPRVEPTRIGEIMPEVLGRLGVEPDVSRETPSEKGPS